MCLDYGLLPLGGTKGSVPTGVDACGLSPGCGSAAFLGPPGSGEPGQRVLLLPARAGSACALPSSRLLLSGPSPAVKLQPWWSRLRAWITHQPAAAGWLGQRARCQPQNIVLASVLCLELLLTILPWLGKQRGLGTLPGTGSPCFNYPVALVAKGCGFNQRVRWTLQGSACSGAAFIGVQRVLHPRGCAGAVGHPGAGDAAAAGCQRSALCCSCLQSLVAPRKPKSTVGASRRRRCK